MTPAVLVAPDKFKGSLTAVEAAGAMARGVRRVWPDAAVRCLPIADGGEGSLACALVAGADAHQVVVPGPLGDPVTATWALFGDGTAVVESAQGSGLAQLSERTPQTAGRADSVGAGELIRAALDAGAHTVVIGVGGSAMTDGGSGALVALGARLLDAAGHPVPPGGLGLGRLARLDLDGLDPRLADVRVKFAVDVTNPLLGPDGAAWLFAGQKGADPSTQAALEEALAGWSAVLGQVGSKGWDQPGVGAGGGLAAPFLALAGATLESGFDVFADLVGLTEALAGADVVLTGEGSLDAQSRLGKGPVALARQAHAGGVPVVAVAGRITLTDDELRADGIDSWASLVKVSGSVAAAIAEAGRWTEVAAEVAVGRLAPLG